MHPVVNHLVQLQELVLIRDEQRVAAGRAHLEKLDASISELTAKLPPDTRIRFDKLLKKNHVVVSPVSERICAMCGMGLPISLVQAVRQGREIQSCPNCARMLFYPESVARKIGATSRMAPRKVGISRFSSPRLMVPQLVSRDMQGTIRELATKMEAEGFVDSSEYMIEEALRREAIVSTAMQHGLAFPHVRGVEGGGLTMAVGVSRSGIRFGGLSRQLTRIVLFMTIPTAASAFYLKLLSGLTESMMKAEARKAIMAEKTPEGLWKALVKQTRSTIK